MGDQGAAAVLKVTTVPIVSALGQDKVEDDLEVLVRVEAPQKVVANKHPPLDLVAVVDVSGSMGCLPDKDTKPTNGEKSRMDYLKEALRFIIDQLHEDDRLSIIQFNENVKHRTPLSPISGCGRESARKLVHSLSPGGRTAFKPALKEAVSILQGRDSRSRVPFVVFLSDGEESKGSKIQWDQVVNTDVNHQLQEVLQKYPVYTFGFSRFHDPLALMAIAKVSKGTYSYIDQGLDKITDAFAVCLGGLTTVVVKDATIALSATAGVTIVGIDSGGYNKVINGEGASGKVYIPVLYEGEVKNFVVHLRVPRAEADDAGVQVILTAGGTYFDATADHGESSTTIGENNNHQLSILRPADGDDSDGGQQRNMAVLGYVTLFKLLNLLEELLKDKELHNNSDKSADSLLEKWSKLKNSSSVLSNNFDKDVQEIARKLREGSGQSFVCSYVSSHQMQRRTIMGSAEDTIVVGYETAAITSMAEKAATHKPAPDPLTPPSGELGGVDVASPAEKPQETQKPLEPQAPEIIAPSEEGSVDIASLAEKPQETQKPLVPQAPEIIAGGAKGTMPPTGQTPHVPDELDMPLTSRSNAQDPAHTWKYWLSSSSWLSVISGAWNNGERVKVEAFTGSSKVVNVVGDTKEECTPVLVRVTAGAPWPLPRTPVDVVAVLNISSGMKGSMERMQEAMAAIISNLDKNDRLSLVLLEDVVSEEGLDLCPMDSKGHFTASEIIKRKTTSTRKFRDCGENLSKDALEIVRYQIGKANEAFQDRQRCVMLLSGGGEDRLTMEDWITRSKDDKFQFHAFDLGAKHDTGRFQSIADKGAGTYHYMGADAKVVIKDAFTAFVVGLKSVVATSVKLTLKAESSFSISSIETGGHYCWWDHKSSSEHGIIDVADMHAGEQRSFIVYLSGGAGATQEKLDKPLMIDGEYLQAGSSSGEKTHLPCLLRGKDVALNSEVAAEIVRVKLVKQVKEMVPKAEAHEPMEDKWKVIRDSDEYKGAHGTELIKIVDRGMDEMMKPECQPHTMMSWLSCHWWQRATAMPHHNYTCGGAFRAPPATMSTIIGTNKSCLGIAGVVLVLVVLMLLRLLVGGHTTITTHFNVTLDVVNHPQWPAMYGGLSATLHMVEEDTTSFFMGVSPIEMSQQIDQYLYMAILYAAALRARYNSTSDSIPDKVVKGHAQAYLQAMLQRINKNDALPAMQVDSVQNMSIAMSHHLQSATVQTYALVTMHAPPLTDGVIKKKQKEVIDTLNTQLATLNTKIDTLITEKATLSTEIVTLKVDIEKMQNCCQLAKRCEQHVKELGGSTEYFGDYVTKTTYSFEFERKEISAQEAVQHAHQRIKELEGAVEHNKVDEFTQEQDVSSRARRSLVV